MAEEKLQVNVDFSKYPELYEALEKLVEAKDTDRSKLIRQLVRDAAANEGMIKVRAAGKKEPVR